MSVATMQVNKKKVNKKRRLAIVLALIVVLVGIGIWQFPSIAAALWSEDDGVHISPAKIENGTLIIGTHLIYMGALTEDLYETALDSAGESAQDRIYYKSELDSGAWCDITEANSLAAISSSYTDQTGMSAISAVDDSVIAALFLSFHTKSDGITYDLRTNSAVNIFDVNNPYDLEHMPELQPLKMQYDLYKEMQAGTDPGDYKISRIDKFWNTNVRSDVTNKADKDLASLQTYLETLGDDASDEMSAVQAVMSSVDATRRAAVFTTVNNVLTAFITQAQSATNDKDDDDAPLTDNDLKTALNDCLANVQTSLTEQEGKKLDRGVTALTSMRYDASNALIDDVDKGDNSAAEKDVARLMDILSIENGTVLHQTSEANLLYSELIPSATTRLKNLLKGGETASYKAANDAAKPTVLTEAASMLNTQRGELESFITAYTKRIVAENSIIFLENRLKETEDWFKLIPSDDFMGNAEICVQNHITFLSQLKLQISQAINGDSLSALLEEKAALQTDYMSALDNNDLAGAKDVGDRIAAIDDEIDAIESETNAQMADLEKEISDKQYELNNTDNDDSKKDLERELNILKAQLTALAASLSPNSVGSLAASLRGEGLSIVENGGNTTDLTNAINSHGDMMNLKTKVAFQAAKDIYDAIQKKNALEGGNAFASKKQSLEAILTDGKAAYDAAISGDKSANDIQDIAKDLMNSLGGDSNLNGGGSGNGTGGTGDGSGSGIGTGGGIGGIGADSGFDINRGKGAIAYINALKEFSAATGSDTAKRMMQAEAQKQLNLGNPFVYKKLDDPTAEYLPITAVRAWYGMRYVWNRNLSNAILTRGTEYYSFTSWGDTVVRSKDKSKSDLMTSLAGFLGCIYIPESYTEENFNCEAVYLPDSDLGILMGEEIQVISDAILELLMQ
jgi:hypothetical protein